MPGVSDSIRETVLRKQADIWARLRHRGDPGMLRRQALRHARSPEAKIIEMTQGGPEVIRGARLGPPPGPQDKAEKATAPQPQPSKPGKPKKPQFQQFRGTRPRRTPMAQPPITIQNIMPSAPKPKGLGIKGIARKAGVYGGAIALGSAALAGLAKAHDAMTFKKDYEAMLNHSPEIKDYDSKAVKARFQTLRRFNPEMSRDPLVASSWIKQTIEYPVVTPATLKDVTQAKQPGPGIPEMIRVLTAKDTV